MRGGVGVHPDRWSARRAMQPQRRHDHLLLRDRPRDLRHARSGERPLRSAVHRGGGPQRHHQDHGLADARAGARAVRRHRLRDRPRHQRPRLRGCLLLPRVRLLNEGVSHMRRAIGSLLPAGLVLIAGTLAVNCARKPVADPEDIGAVHLALTLPGGAVINTVTYSITGGNLPAPITGSIDVSAPGITEATALVSGLA